MEKNLVSRKETNVNGRVELERMRSENYAREGGARGEVVRATATESSNATAAISSFVRTGIIAKLNAGVKTAEPVAAQNGQVCEA
jgi:hypothetical protein